VTVYIYPRTVSVRFHPSGKCILSLFRASSSSEGAGMLLRDGRDCFHGSADRGSLTASVGRHIGIIQVPEALGFVRARDAARGALDDRRGPSGRTRPPGGAPVAEHLTGGAMIPRG
jgi:hypothetical protein